VPALFPFGPLREVEARFCPYCYAEANVTCSVQAHWPEVRRRHPIYLSGVQSATTAALQSAGADIGLILQPGSHLHAVAPGYRCRAADNGCSAQGDTFDPMGLVHLVGRAARRRRPPPLPVRDRPRRSL
jgi:hypothetical protein